MALETLITEKQFTDLKRELDVLFNFLDEVCIEDDLMQLIANANKGVVDTTPPDLMVRLLAMKDIFSCFKEMGHPTNIVVTNKEGQLLMLVAGYYSSIKEGIFLNYKKYRQWIESPLVYTMVDILGHIIEICTSDDVYFKPYVDREDFAVGHILYYYNREYWKRYRVVMYRIASLIAKVDDNIDDDETRWLANIMAITKDDYQTKFVDKSNKNDSENVNAPVLLNELIGLESVKHDVTTIYNFVKMKQEREKLGMKTAPISYHCVFSGNPGTGKTTVARALASIYKELGVLKKGHLVETDRSGLVAEFVGQTAIKTNKIIDKALDGVLFIDEAYALINEAKEDFGREAIATLLKRMEDDRDRLIVILAGYTNEMEDFIQANPGLRSRFSRHIIFPDYSAGELYEIFCLNLRKNEYLMKKEAQQYLKEILEEAVKTKNKGFGNARYVRNLFEKTIEAQANRLSKEANLTREKLAEIKKCDFIDL